MIRTLRNSGIGQLFLGAIVVAIILAFVLTGAGPSQGPSADECVVEIGPSCISIKEYEASLRLVTSIGISEKAVKSLGLREQIARGLAEREVLLEEARRLGVGTSGETIDDELYEGRTRVSLPVEGSETLALRTAMCVDGQRGCAPGTVGLRAINVKQDGKFDYNLYKRTIRVRTGRSSAQFKEMQQREYTAERVRQLIRSQVRVSPDEAFLSYSRARSQATARTVDIKSEWFQTYVNKLSDDEVTAWAKDNEAELKKQIEALAEKWKPGCAVVSELRVDNADPGAEDAEDKREKASELLKKAKIGTDFADLARLTSDSDSAALGGRVGCLDEGFGAGSAVLIEAAEKLSKKGDLSEVTETIQGFHVLKLIAKVTKENREELIREYLSYKLASESLAKKAAETFAQSLIKDATAGGKLSELTEALIEKTLEEGAFGSKDNPGLTSDLAPKSDISRAISIEQKLVPGAVEGETPAIVLFDLKKDDDVAEKPIVTETGFAVIQLKEKDMITREKFDEERASIMETLRKRKAEQYLSQQVTNLITKAGGVRLNEKYVPPAGSEEKEEKKTEKDS